MTNEHGAAELANRFCEDCLRARDVAGGGAPAVWSPPRPFPVKDRQDSRRWGERGGRLEAPATSVQTYLLLIAAGYTVPLAILAGHFANQVALKLSERTKADLI